MKHFNTFAALIMFIISIILGLMGEYSSSQNAVIIGLIACVLANQNKEANQ